MDVLVVGAGPTGLALAAELAAYGVRFRVVDRQPDRVHESRALAIQPRTLEVLARHGLTPALVDRGNRAVRLRLHAPARQVTVPLFDIGVADTAYPFLLFLSQAETERILGEHLRERGVRIERGVDLVDAPGETAVLRHPDGRVETLSARYVVGCDGAHSTVRRLAGIDFAGRGYPQTFVLADLEADGLEQDAAHAWLSGSGPMLFFPLGTPATWRVIAMRPPGAPEPDGPPTLDQVQSLADVHGTGLRLRDPVWLSYFRLHNRGAARYRSGRFFLAGDAAHIHSPAGAQGMNTGIQDAVNLGWKLGLVCRGWADPALLDTYEPERAPVGRTVRRFTDRAFKAATSTNPLLVGVRTRLVPRLAPLALRVAPLRAAAFRVVAELAVSYRNSPLSVDGPHAPTRGPRAGDRLPDAPARLDGQPTSRHAVVAAPGFHLLLYGPPASWDGVPEAVWGSARVAEPPRRDGGARPGLLTVHRLAGKRGRQYLVRPDGHIAYRAGGTDLGGLRAYLERWLPA